MTAETEQLIRDHAHRIWEGEGRPEGRALAHWAMAEAEVARLAGAPAARTPAKTPRIAKPAGKRAAARKAAPQPAAKAAPKSAPKTKAPAAAATTADPKPKRTRRTGKAKAAEV